MDVKICGVCRPEDAAAAAAAGADIVGVIVGAASPRLRDARAAAAIFEAAPGVARAGVFADTPAASVIEAARALRLDVVQLHGGEGADIAGAIREAGRWSVWKALRPRTADEFLDGLAAHAHAVDGVLVDGWSADALGGTGVAAPWSRLRPLRDRVPAGVRLILAGGLTPANVAHAVAALEPDVVDVSSGVERTVGEKSAEKVRAFIAAARGARAPGIGA
jgi:phosphoribosylanthranilate isomerase